MTRLRFATAQEVFDAFPRASEEIKGAPNADPPPAFMRALAASDTPEDAITFCAYTLGRREAVWWGCQCVRSVARIGPGQEDAFLQAAEDWVREPEEGRRRHALRLGMEVEERTPSTWLALAAGWSGGSISPVEGATVPPLPHLTASAVRGAILIALARLAAAERSPRLAQCVEGGLRLMEEGTGLG